MDLKLLPSVRAVNDWLRVAPGRIAGLSALISNGIPTRA